MDISSFLWGAGIGVIGALATGFLKKAGEDGYSWVKKKVNPKACETPKSHLIVHMKSDGVPGAINSISHDGSSSHLDRVSAISPDEIHNSLEKAPPLQRNRIAESYIGLRVEWDTTFLNGRPLDNGCIRLQLSSFGQIQTSVWCEVPADEYRELAILPKRSKIRVYGEISGIADHGIDIKNAQLHIYPRTQ